MATNLLIGHAEIPYASTGVTSAPAAATGYPVTNLFGGNRTEIFRTAANVSGDMIISLPLATTMSTNFLFVGNVNLLNGENAGGLRLRRSTVNNYGTSANEISMTLSSEPLYGSQYTDIIRSFSATTAYQYWWLVISKVGTMYSPFSKLMFGTAFDMGCDPEVGMEVKRFHDHPAQRRPLYRFSLTWQSVARTKAVSFYNTYAIYKRHRPVVLYTTTFHPVLNGARVIYGRFIEITMPPKVTDVNTITATFEEVA